MATFGEMTHRLRMLDTVALTYPHDGFPAGSKGQIVELGVDDYALVEMEQNEREFDLTRLDALVWVPVNNLRSVE